MLHLIEIMANDDDVPYPVLNYVVDIEPPVDAATHEQLQYRLDALLAEAPFDGVEDLYTAVSPIEQIPTSADKDVLANSIAQAALVALEQDGKIFKQ